MSKKAFTITATEDNGRARIEIIGNIYDWNQNSADNFRNKVQELTDKGITDAHIYINSGGGDCFQANEIENIIRAFKGKITGEGGALVASAASYLAVRIKDFALAENCQFMIHKPSTWAGGTDTDIENQLQLLKNITDQYKKAYLEKTTMSETDFLTKWNGGDWWLTSQEAKKHGFISSIIPSVNVDETTAQMIAACGGKPDNPINNLNENSKMNEFQVMAAKLGLPTTATQQDVEAAIIALQNKANEADQLKLQIEAEKKARRQTEIKDLLDAAENDKRITANNRQLWATALDKDFETNSQILAGLAPISKLSDGVTTGGAPAANTYKGKNFEQLQDEDPELLAQLEKENPELFASLFADYRKRNQI